MTKYPPLAMLRLNDFLERVLPMATDDDRMVRKTLASFFQQLMSLCDPVKHTELITIAETSDEMPFAVCS